MCLFVCSIQVGQVYRAIRGDWLVRCCSVRSLVDSMLLRSFLGWFVAAPFVHWLVSLLLRAFIDWFVAGLFVHWLVVAALLVHWLVRCCSVRSLVVESLLSRAFIGLFVVGSLLSLLRIIG